MTWPPPTNSKACKVIVYHLADVVCCERIWSMVAPEVDSDLDSDLIERVKRVVSKRLQVGVGYPDIDPDVAVVDVRPQIVADGLICSWHAVSSASAG